MKIDTAYPEDAAEMAAIERQWSWAELPSSAMSETGALYRVLGAERLAKLTQMPSAICLVARGSKGIDGFILGYHKPLALEIYPSMPSEYADQDDLWSGDFTYIKTVAVARALTGQRIGTNLVCGFRDAAVKFGCPYAIAEISVAPMENRRSVCLFRSTLKANEVGRHASASSGITWGLFRSEYLL